MELNMTPYKSCTFNITPLIPNKTRLALTSTGVPVWSTYILKFTLNYPPRLIDALFGVIGISG